MATELDELKKHVSKMIKHRKFWDDNSWRDVNDFLSPQYLDFQEYDAHRGQRKGTKIYDSSPMIYLHVFSDGMHGNITNPSMTWCRFRLPAHLSFLNNQPQVNLWLQTIQELIFDWLAESNFYSAIRQYFRYGGSFGTAYLICEINRDTNKLVFTAIHPRECYIAENQYGEVDVMTRVINMSAKKMKEKFGENAPFTDSVKTAIEKNPLKEFPVVHMVYPNNEFDSGKFGNRYKKYASKYFEKNRNGKDFLEEKGYDIFPLKVWRYYRGEPGPYGDSPGTFAMAEIMGLQAMRKTLLRAGEQAVDGAKMIPSELEGEEDLNPGGFNYYGPDFQRRIYPINDNINYPIGQASVEDSREILKQHFHVDTFLTMQASKDRVKTAQEVFEMKSESSMILSASVGDLTSTLDSVLDYVFHLRGKAGQLPEPPQILIDHLGSARIPIEYMGPLAQAQKRMFQTSGILDSLEILGPMFEAFPDIKDIFNGDVIARKIAMSYLYPQDAFNSPETIKMIREGRNIQMQEEAKKLDMDRMAEFLKKFSQADKNSGGKLWGALNNLMGAQGNQQPGVGMEMAL